MERPPRLAARERRVGFARTRAGALGIERDDGVQPWIQAGDAREVVREHVTGRRVQGDETRLAELGASDRQHRRVEIDVL